jgi:quinoprotein glucose dehydrogenase
MRYTQCTTFTFACLLLLTKLSAQTDWPSFGRDPGANRYSPLKQIDTTNVSTLQLVWQFDTEIVETPPPPIPGAAVMPSKAAPAAAPPRQRRRMSESIPLVVDGVLYMSTAYNRIVALEAATGNKIWEYESKHPPALRGVSFWPGNKTLPAQVVFGTVDGWLISLNAKTGKPVPGFGAEGLINLKIGVTDKYPNAHLGLTSPPAFYHDFVITGSSPGETPAFGASGDIRAWDMHTGKLAWTFHTIPRPGELNHGDWKDDEWAGRSGVNSWGFTTVDVERSLIFVPIGTPNNDFWGGDRKGSNLYGATLVALDAATGKLKWYFQTTHHDNWDYDLASAPLLIDVKRNGKSIPAVAQITKQGYLFIFDRLTGKPLYDVKEVPVPDNNPTPGDQNWPTQPIPVKPPPLARTSFKPEEIATVTPEHEKYCRDLLAREGGALTGGPFAHYGPKLSVIFPSWTGGTNWGGGSYDPQLGYIFVDTKSLANFSKLVPRSEGGGYARVGPNDPPAKMGDYFWNGAKQWPCQQPPWGEMVAVNVNTGDIAWRVPLGSFEELDKLGIPKTGTPTTNGGSIATAGGLVFIGATVDGKFRAFDSHSGKELWVTDLGVDVNSIPITWQGKDGRQYVAVFASGGAHHDAKPGRLLVYSLPKT